MKIAIAQRGKADCGKTTTIRLVFDLLRADFPKARIEEQKGSGKDFRAIVVIGRTLIGFESLGDPSNRRQEESLDLFVARGCKGIVCACRTSGRTVKIIESLNGHGYTIQWRERVPKHDVAAQQRANKAEVAFALSEIRKLIP